MSYPTTPALVNTQLADNGSTDAFGRGRVSEPMTLHESHFQYDLQPLLYEQIVTGTGAIAHDAASSMATLSIAGAGTAAMQSYKYIRYQPGKSQEVLFTSNYRAAVAGAYKRYGLFDATNGFFFEQSTTGQLSFNRRSSTTVGNLQVFQSAWNLDKLDGTGPSGITLDITKTQIIYIDAQWLGVGRVRMGFVIHGSLVLCHEFEHANFEIVPYTRTLTLPIRCEIGGTATASMDMICTSVSSEGGVENEPGFGMSVEGTGTAGNGVRAHILSIQQKPLFNSITNRSQLVLDSIDITVTGNTPIKWELVLGQAISGTTTMIDVNTIYSGVQYNTLGAISGSPAIVIASGYCSASAITKATVTRALQSMYPLGLDAAGVVRLMGRLSVLATGLGATSACRAILGWKEIR